MGHNTTAQDLKNVLSKNKKIKMLQAASKQPQPLPTLSIKIKINLNTLFLSFYYATTPNILEQEEQEWPWAFNPFRVDEDVTSLFLTWLA